MASQFPVPRGISKSLPILIAFTLLAALGLWIWVDLYRKGPEIERAAELKRFEDAQRQGLVAPPQSSPAITQPALNPAPGEFICHWAQAPLTLTGNGSDPIWQSAQVIDNFAQPWLGPNSLAKSHTQSRLLWDDEFLYFQAIMEDADLYATVSDHNGMAWFNDVFELFFKPSAANLGYYEFEITPRNTTLELYFPSRGSGGYGRWKNKFPFHLESKVSVRGTLNDPSDRDQGWTVEGRIPWKDFTPTGGKPLPGSVWKMALCRYDYSAYYDHEEMSTCAPLKGADFHRYEDYCTLRFEGALK